MLLLRCNHAGYTRFINSSPADSLMHMNAPHEQHIITVHEATLWFLHLFRSSIYRAATKPTATCVHIPIFMLLIADKH